MIIAFVLLVLVGLLIAIFKPVATMTVLFGISAGYVAMIALFWALVEYPFTGYILLALFVVALLYDPKRKKDSSLRGDKKTS